MKVIIELNHELELHNTDNGNDVKILIRRNGENIHPVTTVKIDDIYTALRKMVAK